jgi:BirA family transcriptional regulator, biotin operon repressor / biotin---[acetyl-CoA-carboxylase] ligase
MEFAVHRFETVGSTNTVAAEQAKNGAPEGYCVVARQQTAGRGRHGRTWISERGAGLYLSLVLRPLLPVEQLPLITLMAGVAAYDTFHHLGLSPDIKWVNDILLNERKVSGVLAETVETPIGNAVVLGIGINLTSGNIPSEMVSTATSLQDEGAPIDSVEEVLLERLDDWYAVLTGEKGAGAIIQAWRQRSSYYSGKAVRITLHENVIEGITDGLEPNGALRVRSHDGVHTIVHAGEVERLRSAEASAN